jgi:hypothetical protein
LIYLNTETLELQEHGKERAMTETLSHWIDGKRRDGYSGRTAPVFDLTRGKERARDVITPAVGGSLPSLPLFCPP